MNIVVTGTPLRHPDLESIVQLGRYTYKKKIKTFGVHFDGLYYLHFKKFVVDVNTGDLVFFVIDNLIVAYCVVSDAETINERKTAIIDKKWTEGFLIVMDATTLKWIKPVKMENFRGYKPCDLVNFEVVADYTHPQPGANPPNSCPISLANENRGCYHPKCNCQWLF